MPRRLDEIAADVAEYVDASPADIVQLLCAVQRAHQEGADVVRAAEIKADIAAERLRLQELAQKWRGSSTVAFCVNEADQWLAVLANVTGPDPRYHWFDDYCVILARSMILQSPNKRLGDRLRLLSGLFYEAATGVPDRSLETACRRVTSKKVFERLPHISASISLEGVSTDQKQEK